MNLKKLAVVVRVLQTTRIWSFHVVFLQRTAKKCTKNYDAHAQPSFYSLNLLFCDVVVAVVVFLNSLLTFEHNVDRDGRKERKLCALGANATKTGAINIAL